MSHKYPKPVWWLLYVLMALLIGLLILEHQLALTPFMRMLVQIGIVLFIFACIGLWLLANAVALECDEYDQSVESSQADESQSTQVHFTPVQANYRKVMATKLTRGVTK